MTTDWLIRDPGSRYVEEMDRALVPDISDIGGRRSALQFLSFEDKEADFQRSNPPWPAEPHLLAPEWVVAISQGGRDSLSTETLVKLIEGLGRLMRERRYDSIDELLSTIPLSNWAPEAMLALVRIPYTVRHSLKQWGVAVKRVDAELQSRGIDSTKALRGLVLETAKMPAE